MTELDEIEARAGALEKAAEDILTNDPLDFWSQHLARRLGLPRGNVTLAQGSCQGGEEIMTDRTNNYDALLARESESRERLAKARHAIRLQLGNGSWSLNDIDHILEGGREMNEDRFWAKVNKSGDCWEWIGWKNRWGYGQLSANKKRHLSHRVSYQMAKGPIPDGMFIDHICRNRACVRPEHLRIVNAKENGENRSGARSDSKSGVLGVSWRAASRKWTASVMHNGKQHHLGLFTDIEHAEASVKAKRLELYTHNDADRQAS